MGSVEANKRRFYITQSCLDAMRENHPEEYNKIVEEANRLLPGGKPRLQNVSIIRLSLDEENENHV